MGHKTISLDDDAYVLLRRAKRSGESFSAVVHRLLGPRRPRLAELVGFMTVQEADRVAAVIQRMKDEDIAVDQRRLPRGR